MKHLVPICGFLAASTSASNLQFDDPSDATKAVVVTKTTGAKNLDVTGTVTASNGQLCSCTEVDSKVAAAQTASDAKLAALETKLTNIINAQQDEINELKAKTTKTCKELVGTAATGVYSINGHSTFCDMDTDGGGWTMVWKHNYYEQADSDWEPKKFYSTTLKACNKEPTDSSLKWCNIPDKKLKFSATEMMIAGYHNSHRVFAYKGGISDQIEQDWRAAIMPNPAKIEDKCSASNGSPPEPVDDATGHGIGGLTFDKTNPGNYVSNCDTDRYGGGGDCRWENCHLPSSISSTTYHVQQTYAMFVR